MARRAGHIARSPSGCDEPTRISDEPGRTERDVTASLRAAVRPGRRSFSGPGIYAITTPSAFRPSERPLVLAALVADEGSAADGYRLALASGRASARDLSDALHLLCALHGRHPGVVDHALARTANPPHWLLEGAAGFARERGYVAQLVAAAGPMPSTPRQAECEATVAGQRHAISTLARSEREGCTLGAAAAILLDWRAVRTVLDAAASRFAVALAPATLPGAETICNALPAGAGAERAESFAAGQVLAQHRGLWRLLQARAAARDHA